MKKQGGARIGAGRKKAGDVNYKRTVTEQQKIELDKLLKTLRKSLHTTNGKL